MSGRGHHCRAAVEAGRAGIGIEDTTGDPGDPIRPVDDAVARARHATAAAKGRIVVTCQADNFVQGIADLEDTIRRPTAFAEVRRTCSTPLASRIWQPCERWSRRWP